MKKYLCIVCLLLTGTALMAQQEEQSDLNVPARIIRMDEAVSLALKNNLSLQAGSINLEKARRPADRAWNQFLPVVGVSSSLGAVNEVTSTTNPFTGQTIDGPRWSLSGTFQVQWQGLNYAMFEGIKQLKQAYAAGEVSYAKVKTQMERDVRKLYITIALAEKNLEVQEHSLALSEEQVRMATANFRAGLSPELSLLQASLNRDNKVPAIEEIRNNIKMSKANLSILMGLPFDTDFSMEAIELAGMDIKFDTNALIRAAIGNKIDIQETRANITARRTARNALRYQLWTPSLGITWNATPTFQGDPFSDEWGSNSWKDNGRLNLTLSWSLNGLFPFTTQAADLNNLNDDLRILDINLAQQIRSAEVEVFNAVFLIEHARDSAAAQEKTVELARKTYNDTLTAFRAGLQNFTEVQDVEQNLRQAQLGVLQQQFNFINGVTDLEYAAGVPFGSLRKNSVN